MAVERHSELFQDRFEGVPLGTDVLLMNCLSLHSPLSQRFPLGYSYPMPDLGFRTR